MTPPGRHGPRSWHNDYARALRLYRACRQTDRGWVELTQLVTRLLNYPASIQNRHRAEHMAVREIALDLLSRHKDRAGEVFIVVSKPPDWPATT